MKKYIVAIWRMLTSKKWILVSIKELNNPRMLMDIVNSKCDTIDYHQIGNELMDISAEYSNHMVEEVLRNSERPTVVIPFPPVNNN